MPETSITGLSRPTLDELISRTQLSVNVAKGDQRASHDKTIEHALSLAVAAVSDGLYTFLLRQERQRYIQYADEEGLQLAAERLQTPRRGAISASGPVTLTGTIGAELAAGFTWQRSDGVEFELDEDLTFSSTTETANVTCLTPGVTGNTAASVELGAVIPNEDVSSTAIVSGDGIVDGFDLEELEEWRERLLFRNANPPGGGNDADWYRWTREVSGVDDVWIEQHTPYAGDVTIWFSVVDTGSGIIPTESMVETVQAYLSDPDRKPGAANPIAQAISTTEIDIDFDEYAPESAAVWTAMQDEVSALLARRRANSATIYNSELRGALQLATGLQYFVLNDINGGSPDSDIEQTVGVVPILGTFSLDGVA